MGFSFHRWQYFPIFFWCLFLTSGASSAEKHPSTLQNEMEGNQQKRMLISIFTTHKDSVPEINPTPTTPPTFTNPTPTTTPPTFTNPTSPPGPISTSPTTPPSTPMGTMPTSPTTTPSTPMATPSTPMGTMPTSPTTTPTTPTTPTTTPTSPTTTSPGSSGGSWCIASQSASETALQVALDYACGYGGADCSPIQSGGSCYNPNTVRDHASYAFNDYYQKNPAPTSCAFGGTAQLTSTDPSKGSCHFASSKSSTTSMTPPTFETPPASPETPTTPTMATPTGSTSSIYGSEPTGSPSSAPPVSYRTMMQFSMTGLLGSIFAVFYL